MRGAIDALKVDDALKHVLHELMSRVDKTLQDLIFQLKKEPTIFTVDPATHTEDVEGAKAGDIAIFVTAEGVVDIKVFE
ncbi:MAG: hypothetical protein WC822_01570 [Candidatus Paceibacterota bacterium]|jgi:hypothetical protein